MKFEIKLKEILKSEKTNFIALTFILIFLLPFLIWYIFMEYHPQKILSLLAIIPLYLLLGCIVYKKRKIIKEIKWSIRYYDVYPTKVQDILKQRKISLNYCRGKNSLYSLYDEALKMNSI